MVIPRLVVVLLVLLGRYMQRLVLPVREFIDRIELDADRRGGVGRFFKLDRNHTNIEEEYKKRFGS